MKNANTWMAAVWLLAGLIGGPGLRAQDKDASAPTATKQSSADSDSKAEKTDKADTTAKEAPADSDTAKPDSTERPAARPAATRPANRGNQPGSDRMLRLNFRGAPLETVLNYLSEAAGFIIVLETDVRGKVDAWSNQPVTQEEALSILDAALSKNGYAALRNGRTLTVINKDNAKRRDIPVKTGSNPAGIPKNEEIVTQIIPLRYISASQLTQNLQSLLPSSAELTANEGGNALIMTDTQINIRRITEIIRALDTSMASATTIRVFPLQFADAKDLANVIKELFPAQNTGGGGAGGFGGFGGGNNNRGGFGQGGGFPGGFGQGGFGQGGAGAGAGGFGGARTGGGGGGGVNRAAASRVVAVADEHSNSLVVNAPDDVMPEIEELIAKVDTSVEDVTELRVFRLKHADPIEMAEVLSNLFPDDTKSNDNSRSQVRFGGGPFAFGGGGNTRNAAAAGSERAKKKGRVLAVPDQRTSSVIVSAAHDLMGQIGEMVAQLDSNPARKQKVFVYDLQNADPQQVQDVLRNLFENQNTMNRNTRSGNQNQSSALTTRANQSQNNRNTSGSFGSGGGGGTGFGGGRAGGN